MLVLRCLAILYRMAGVYLLPGNKTRKKQDARILGILLSFSLSKVRQLFLTLFLNETIKISIHLTLNKFHLNFLAIWFSGRVSISLYQSQKDCPKKSNINYQNKVCIFRHRKCP